MAWLIKTSFAFAGLEQGWSETFYWSSTTDDLNAAETAVTPLAQKRAKLLSKSYVLTIVRNAIVVDDGGAKVKRITDLFEPRLSGVASWADAEPNVALMCSWQTGNNKASKKLYMRGVPAGIVDMGKAPNMAFGAFMSNFNAWRAAMVAFQAGWLVSAPSLTAFITNYVQDATTGKVTFTLAAPGIVWPLGFAKAQRVYVSVPGKSPLDGPLIIVPTTAISCYTKDSIGVGPWQNGAMGIMQIRTPSLVTLAPVGAQGNPGIIHPQRMVTHKTGRPTYASRGRVAPRAKW